MDFRGTERNDQGSIAQVLSSIHQRRDTYVLHRARRHVERLTCVKSRNMT